MVHIFYLKEKQMEDIIIQMENIYQLIIQKIKLMFFFLLLELESLKKTLFQSIF